MKSPVCIIHFMYKPYLQAMENNIKQKVHGPHRSSEHSNKNTFIQAF